MTQSVRSEQGDHRGGIRSFIAVALPDDIRRSILDVGGEVCSALRGVSCTRKVENLHLTVAFLGNVLPDVLDRLAIDLAGAVASIPAFRLTLHGMGAFPSASRARVLWVGARDGAQQLADVAAVVRTVVERAGLPVEDRPFRCHITFARAHRAPVDVRTALVPYADRHFGDADVTELHLYESRLGREGSTYSLRSRAPLAAHSS